MMLRGFLRRLSKTRWQVTVNIVGLAVGMACAIMIFIYAGYEFSFDAYHKNASRVYRIYSHINIAGHDFSSSMAPPPLSNTVSQLFPEIASSTRIWSYSNIAVTLDEPGYARHEKLVFNEKRLIQADSSFFDVFDFKIKQGSKTSALIKPFSLVITEQTALRYFGLNALKEGKIVGHKLALAFEGKDYPCTITAVSENVPQNSHFHFDIILSNATDPWNKSDVWVDNTYYTYVALRPGADPRALESKFLPALKHLLDKQIQKYFQTTLENIAKSNGYWEYRMQAMGKIHLDSAFARELEPNESKGNVYIVLIFGIFILLAAVINYTNLSIAGSLQRSREAGVRKTLGAGRMELMKQFFLESAFLCCLAAGLAACLIVLFLLYLSATPDLPFHPSLMLEPEPWIMLVSCTVFAIFAGAFYPAFVLSSVKVTEALKGKQQNRSGSAGIRKVLVITQFCISVGLVFSMVIVQKQMKLIREKNPGYDRENIIAISDPSEKLGDKSRVYIDQLCRQAPFLTGNVCSDFPGGGGYPSPFSIRSPEESRDHLASTFSAGYDFLKTFGVKLVEGRDFSRMMDHADARRVIINQAAARELGLSHALGKYVILKDLNSLHFEETRLQIIGVVNDFNFESLHHAIRPMAITLSEKGSFITLRVKSRQITDALLLAHQAWKKALPGVPFEYTLVDEQLNQLYRSDLGMGKLLEWLTLVMVSISAIGLLGLSIELISQRVKEIAVRKVLGANIPQILFLLGRQYLAWVLVAICISGPLVWLLMSGWLRGFAYRTNIQIGEFLLTGLSSLLVVVITVGWQSFRAAAQNPVKSLKTD